MMEIKEAPLCECGCGQSVKWSKEEKAWNRYIKGHALLKYKREHPEKYTKKTRAVKGS